MMLERLDVRIKIAVFFALMVALFVITDPISNALVLCALLGALIAARMPLNGLWLMVQPLLLVLVFIVPVTMVTGGPFARHENASVLFRVCGMDATLGGLLVGCTIVIRILAMVAATYAFTISTSVDDLMTVMAQVHVPYWLSVLITTAISFIPTMGRKKDLIFEAQRARGARVPGRGPLGQIVSFVPIMVPLMTNSILLADSLAVAMTNRGYGATNAMTRMRDLRLRASDIAVLAATLALLAAVLWYRYGLGLGVV